MPIPSFKAVERIRRAVKWTEQQRSGRSGPSREFSHSSDLMIRLFRINGAGTQDGSNMRWVYPAKLLGNKSGAGYAGTWSDSTQDTTEYSLYSLAEKINTSSGTYGNGATQANLNAVNDSDGGTDGTMALKPLTTNNPVVAVGIYLDDGTLEWWIINWPNGVDGVCPVPA